MVSRGANLDPDLTVPTTKSYLLEITAFDQGVGDNKRYGKTHVNVTIGMYAIPKFKKSFNSKKILTILFHNYNFSIHSISNLKVLYECQKLKI